MVGYNYNSNFNQKLFNSNKYLNIWHIINNNKWRRKKFIKYFYK